MRGGAWLAALALVGLVLVPVGVTEDADNGTITDLPSGAVPNEVVVGFLPGAEPAILGWVAARGHEPLMTGNLLDWMSFRTVDAAAADAAIAELSERADVRWAERDGYVSTLHVPNDPFYGSQWGFPAIQAEAAWDIQRGSHDVIVAILDTGIEGTHPDLVANICDVPHQSFVPNQPPLIDGHFHGTHVAGTVAALSDNGIGVAGTSQSCLMAVKVLANSGGGQWTWIAAGISHAAENGAHIISMSLGGGNPGLLVVDEAVAVAYAVHGSLIIAAAGNSGCFSGDSVIWPARYAGVMAVASLAAPGDVRSGFSSCGPRVEIAAPGSNVLSTSRLGGYGYASGTSMAAPHVSGVAALVMSEYPGLTAAAVRCVLALTADDVLAPGVDIHSGWGRVNAERAVTLDIDVSALVGSLGSPNSPYHALSCTPEAVAAILTLALP